jgi:hypothetical protein
MAELTITGDRRLDALPRGTQQISIKSGRAAAVGFAVSVLISVGVAPIITAALAYGLYLGIALHALDVSRRVHPSRVPRDD